MDAKRIVKVGWMLIKGRCYGRTFTFATIYAPNSGQAPYFWQVRETIEDFVEGTLILGGDWNVAINLALDISHSRSLLSSQNIKSLKQALTQGHLLDPWQTLYPEARDYT